MNVKKTIAIAFTLLFLSFCPACSNSENVESEQIIVNSVCLENGAQCFVLAQEELYWVELIDEQNDIHKELGPFSHSPEIDNTFPEILKISYQAGTGKATKWNLYYSSCYGKLSSPFYNVLAENGEIIVFGSGNVVVIQNAFREDLFYHQIVSFKEELSPAVDPFVCAQIASDYSYIEITYLAGNDYHEITETFFLNGDP